MILHETPFVPCEGCPAWWHSLWEASRGATVFTSSAWIATWIEVYGDQFGGWWLRWEEGGRVIAAALLLRRVIWRRLVPWRSIYLDATGEGKSRSPLAEYNDVLCIPGHENAVGDSLLRWLRDATWDRLVLSGYEEERSMVASIAPRVPAVLVRRRAVVAPFVDLTRVRAGPYEDGLSANARSQIRRSRRLYEAERGSPVVSSAQDATQAQAYLTELSRLHNARWATRGMRGSFAHAEVARFHDRLLPRLWDSGRVDLLKVAAGNEVIGYLYNFIDGGKVSFFQSGFVYEGDSRLKPGLVAHALAIEHYRARGLSEYDLLAGDDRYKRTLAKDARTMVWSVVFRDRPWIRLLVRIWNATRDPSRVD